MKIKMHAVKSTNLRGVGYDEATQTLAVEFKKGVRWHYAGVPPQLASGIVTADSPGSFFGKHIRGRFKETKVERKKLAK